jgi:hypothetical protein
MLRAMASKRRTPKKISRRTSREYFSPITPRVSAIEQGRVIVVMPPV